MGLSVEETLALDHLSALKDEFAGDDPVVRYYFDEYFAKPNVTRTYQAIVDAEAPESR